MYPSSSRVRLGETSIARVPACALACALSLAIVDVRAQETTAPTAPVSEATTLDAVVVSARKREESLVEVPISISAVGQETLERNALQSVADIAPMVPGLNINSDAVGRAFVSIRGIGTALQAGVQPGVGVFQDGIYVRETSYVNNPMLDVERVEVLRGPQGTLYGKNTLGGAINIITRQPRNVFEGKVYASYAEGNGAYELGARLSGPVLGDRLRGKLAVATRESDGFFRNRLAGGPVDAASSDQASLSLVWDAADEVYVTTNAYYLDFSGSGVNYSHIDGPTDYRDNVNLNVTSEQSLVYQGGNVKVEFPLRALETTATAILAYDRRELDGVGDGDYLALDVVRTRGNEDSETWTGELRFDTRFSDRFSTLVGFFASRETSDTVSVQRLVPAGVDTTAMAQREADTYAAFGTAIWRFADDWEFSAGLRLDKERRRQQTSSMQSIAPGTVVMAPRQQLDSSELQPRVSLSRFFDNGWMGYASIARGYRGGGFNPASVPAQYGTYGGDAVWTYELGAKFGSADGRYLWSNAVYYNDYTDFIGQNALARGPGGGLVSIDLNLGAVESYGLESEFTARMTDRWSLYGGLSRMHGRITDQGGWIALVGTPLATDRLLFQPDWNVSLGSDYTVPVGAGALTWNLAVMAKGSRPGSSFDPVTPSMLEAYHVVNTSLSWRQGGLTLGLFANNLFDEKYFESYIDGSLLAALGLLDQNLGIPGAPRNVGVRVQYAF